MSEIAKLDKINGIFEENIDNDEEIDVAFRSCLSHIAGRDLLT